MITPVQPGSGNAPALKAGSNGAGAGDAGAANQVVRLQPDAGGGRTQSGADNDVAGMYCP